MLHVFKLVVQPIEVRKPIIETTLSKSSMVESINMENHYYNSWFFKRSKLINNFFFTNGHVHFDYKPGA
jgi:hypothetical protein